MTRTWAFRVAQMVKKGSVSRSVVSSSLLPGASVRNPAHGKGHEEGSPTKRKGVIWLQGFPLSFPEHLPPKTRVGLILLYCAFPLF